LIQKTKKRNIRQLSIEKNRRRGIEEENWYCPILIREQGKVDKAVNIRKRGDANIHILKHKKRIENRKRVGNRRRVGNKERVGNKNEKIQYNMVATFEFLGRAPEEPGPTLPNEASKVTGVEQLQKLGRGDIIFTHISELKRTSYSIPSSITTWPSPYAFQTMPR
jgi:hypothetical protein